MKQGFTLIELLVVVLIIGILSAIALPQYQKSVLKSRMAAALPRVVALETAEKEYKMANGSFTGDLSAMSIDTGMWSCNASTESDQRFCQFSVTNGLSWELNFATGDRSFGIYCIATGDDNTDTVCRNYGEYSWTSERGNRYYLVRRVY